MTILSFSSTLIKTLSMNLIPDQHKPSYLNNIIYNHYFMKIPQTAGQMINVNIVKKKYLTSNVNIVKTYKQNSYSPI